jgi:hypothetical protein
MRGLEFVGAQRFPASFKPPIKKSDIQDMSCHMTGVERRFLETNVYRLLLILQCPQFVERQTYVTYAGKCLL